MLIFDHTKAGRKGAPQSPKEKASISDIPASLLRTKRAPLPEVSEMQAVRHYTRLSRKKLFD